LPILGPSKEKDYERALLMIPRSGLGNPRRKGCLKRGIQCSSSYWFRLQLDRKAMSQALRNPPSIIANKFADGIEPAELDLA
jgi:hypothetical protein